MHGQRGLEAIPFKENYSSSGSSLLNDFYIPALTAAQRYDRSSGYFSSAILALAPIAFSEFVDKGGRMRLLCSPHLTAADAEALLDVSEESRPSMLEVAASSLRELGHGTDLEKSAVRCMRSLIEAGVLEIRFVTSGSSGLYHDKVGVFSDEYGSSISFIGSANETAAAWSGFNNHEQIEVFRSWTSEADGLRISRHRDLFEETWHGLRRGLRVTRSDEAGGVVLSQVPSEPVEKIVRTFREAVGNEQLLPEKIQLRDYQSAVLEAWEKNGFKGLVAFATGGGKTRTALEAIREWTHSGRPALVLVPSELLHKQWSDELRKLLPNASVLHAGAGHSRMGWSRRLGDYTRDDRTLGQRVVLATYQTAATDGFLSLVRGGGHLLVVGDEVHRVGAPDTRKILFSLPAGGRLGLSATPSRFGDSLGTEAIVDYFGETLDPVFSLADAVESGVLVPYDYHFEACPLNDDESERWDDLTRRVSRDIARNDGNLSDYALHLLRQRARISKSAAAKADIALSVLSEHYEEGDRWLIYCSDTAHLREVRAKLDGMKIDLLEYHSATASSHESTIEFFTKRGGVLLAIKCLDEGIDIPMINKALILASSTNPREYIQRRGRVLRKSPGKYSAVLFDVIVVGSDGKAITASEVRRALEFADGSRNVAPRIYLENLMPEGSDKMSSLDFEAHDE
ncbi:DEAD/DEAH box helicase family protein [Dietzia maris]|uniref:DEAD/DEAH box helicase family protein n=1 Tax=Dietzia maris TaxID=37915 RepID=UPI0037CA1509